MACSQNIRTLISANDNRIKSDILPRPLLHVNGEQITQPGGIRTLYEIFSCREYITYIERQESTARYIRSVINILCREKNDYEEMKIPFAITLIPFPTINPYETKPIKIDLTAFSNIFNDIAPPEWSQESMNNMPKPLQCCNCNSIINSFYKFGANEAICNFCGSITILPAWYAKLLQIHFKLLSEMGNIREILENNPNLHASYALLSNPYCRSELLQGTIDFVHYDMNSILNNIKKAYKDTNQNHWKLPAGLYWENNNVEKDNENQKFIMFNQLFYYLVICLDINEKSATINLYQSVLYYLSQSCQKWTNKNLRLAILLFDSTITTVAVKCENEHLKIRKIVVMPTSDEVHIAMPSNEIFVEFYGDFTDPINQCKLDEYIQIISYVAEQNLEARINNPQFTPSDHINCSYVCILLATKTIKSFITKDYRKYIGGCIQIYTCSDIIHNTQPDTQNAGILDLLKSPIKHLKQLDSNTTIPLSSNDSKIINDSQTELNNIQNLNTINNIQKINDIGNRLSNTLKKNVSKNISKLKTSTISNLIKNKPANNTFEQISIRSEIYKSVLSTCYNNNICINTYYAGDSYDVSTPNNNLYMNLARCTNGVYNYIPSFDINIHYKDLYASVLNIFEQGLVFNVTIRLFASKGIKIKQIYNCHQYDNSLPKIINKNFAIIRLPVMRPDNSINIVLDFQSVQPLPDNVYFQAIIDYTNIDGYQYTRTINKKFNTSNNHTKIYKNCDYEPLVYHYVQELRCNLSSVTELQNKILTDISEMFSAYRINLPNNSSRKQLIIPESFKGLPLYMQSFFKQGCIANTNLLTNENYSNYYNLFCRGIVNCLSTLYPIIYPIHRSINTIKDERLDLIGTKAVNNFSYWLPQSIAATGAQITSDGIFLMMAETYFIVYLGNDADPSVISEIMLSCTISKKLMLLNLNENSSQFVHRIFNYIEQICVESYKTQVMPVYVIQMLGNSEHLFVYKLLEDRINNGSTYVDFLLNVSI